MNQGIFTSRFIGDYIRSISERLKEVCPEFRLTLKQEKWLSFVLTGILLTNSINWSAYSRQSLATYKVGAISWMFRNSGIDFEKLLIMSIVSIISSYGLKNGVLEVDDTENERSKNAKDIFGLGKVKDKRSGGYFKGQNIVFLVLVTEKVTLPVGFKFYQNDPSWVAWKKEDEYLRKKGVAKKYRPKEVARDYDKYPTKQSLGIELIKEFKKIQEVHFSDFKIKSILADCFYGTRQWTRELYEIYPKTQIISQLKKSQKIIIKGKEVDLFSYFRTRALIKKGVVIRGGKKTIIYYSSLIATVKAHGEKRLIIAYKYEGEKELRYLFATDMTWTVQTIIEVYSLRWLVEVFIQDWKLYEGWANLSKHIGEEGANSSLRLSLLFDHCLLLHPKQKRLIKNKLPAATVGSLRNFAQQEHTINVFKELIKLPNPKEILIQWIQAIEDIFILKSSDKHLVAKDFAW